METIETTNDNLLPLPISALLDKQFFIPHYQRGYRWTDEQVIQFLDDIDSFIPRELSSKSDDKTFYCLQPIVVKQISEEKKKSLIKKDIILDGEWYEVIDGQQRLTTIFIILQYINQEWLGKNKIEQFKINFETRPGCVEFLNNLKIEDDDTVKENKENIDFYHISKALKTVKEWQSNYEGEKKRMLDSARFQSIFLSSAKVIWYKVADNDADGRPLFERLNLGKIPLTNAELTKALFLSSESFNDIPEEEKKIKQYEIARLWDEIEHKLNEEDLKFWSFVTNTSRASYETKIDLILDLISGKTEEEKNPFFTFLEFQKKQKEGNLLDVWKEIEHFFYTLAQWYQDKNYYHKVGYLVTAKTFSKYKGVDLGELVKNAMNNAKSVFQEQLNNLIKESVKVELSELRYDNHYNQIFNVLLLFNVETNRQSDAITEYYPFKQHKSNQWSLEHIHARNSENFDKSKREPWNEWLNLHKPLLIEFSETNKDDEVKDAAKILLADIELYNTDLLTWERFSSLFIEVNNFFTKDEESLDRESEGIRNLALLSQADNSALSNAVFEIKRRAIIGLDKRGSFIPICTRRAFMKYYRDNSAENQNYYWSKEDREAYFQEIENRLEEFLPVNHIEEEQNEN